MSGTDPMRELTHDEVVEMGGAFVLGGLDASDAAAVRAHLATCALDHSEIPELGAMLPVLDASVPVVEPPAGLKGRIMAVAAAEAAAAAPDVAGPVSAATLPEPTTLPTADERAARRRRTGRLPWVLNLAAVIAIIALGASVLILRNQLNDAQAYQQAVTAVIDVAGQTDSLTAILNGVDTSGTGLAAIDATGKMTLAMQDLAPTSGSTVYTAWAIGSDGVPSDVGSFTVGRGGTGSLSADGVPTTAGIVLALTMEPEAGLTAPTGSVVAKGVANSAS